MKICKYKDIDVHSSKNREVKVWYYIPAITVYNSYKNYYRIL